MLELYHAGLTTCSKKSRLCLREKGLPYKSHYIRLDRFRASHARIPQAQSQRRRADARP